MNDYLDRIEAQLTELTERGAHQRLRARRLGLAGRGGGGGGSRPPQRRSEVLALVAAAAVVAAVVAVVLVNVHSGKPSRPAASTHPAPATTHHATTTTPPAPTQTPPTRTQTRTEPLVALPAHFAPQSFSAISELTWWLLGPSPCASPHEHSPCGSIALTTNGGRTFVGIPAPAAPLVVQAGGYTQLRFADADNGFAYDPGLYATHDGGATWHPIALGGVVADLATSDGEVYAAVGGSGKVTLMRSPVGQDAWTTVSAAGPIGTGLWVQGADVIVGSGPGGGTSNLGVSQDGGVSFANHPSPSPGFPCSYQAPTPPVLWAECPTGTESGVWRSTDLGAHFAPAHPASRPGQPNSAVFAAASANTAVYGYRQLYRTSDAGATWSPVGPAGIAQWAYLGFTDSTHGVGLAYVGSIAPGNARLYYTTDGGQTYHLVALP